MLKADDSNGIHIAPIIILYKDYPKKSYNFRNRMPRFPIISIGLVWSQKGKTRC